MYIGHISLTQAAIRALETAKDLGHKTLEIKTDSMYTINGKEATF